MNRYPNARLLRSTRAALGALLATAAVMGCAGSDDSGQTIIIVGEDVEEAEAGTAGGACLEGNTCLGDNLQCYAGICREPVCLAGDLDCACYANSTCNTRSGGGSLVCEAGICREPSCEQGALGCGCFAGATCNAGLFCSDESGSLRCEMASCAVGELGCGCRTDRTCNTTSDGGALICDGALCVAATCTVGSDSCACRPDYSCNAGLACGQDGRCGRADCSRGELGCGCLANGACATGLFCGDDNLCQSRTCEQGTEGCGCFADWSCTPPTGGGLLTCQSGQCVRAACVPGTEGCGCTGAGACNDSGLACQQSYCVAVGCVAGTIGCPCASGACGDDLTCSRGLCVDSTGMSGGNCYENGTCDAGLRCDDESASCVPCALGSADCACFSNGTCVAGLACAAGRCVADSGQVDEERHRIEVCYSPCTEGAELNDATYIPCSSDGFMQFCLDGTECVEGSCVPVGEGPRECTSDLDCPTFQACINDQCWSECDYHSQCADGLRCWQHVCRQPCLASGAACPDGNACTTVDGEAGYCLPTPEPDGDDAEVIDGALILSRYRLPFTNTNTRAAFTVINSAPRARVVTVRFVRHSYRDNQLGTNVIEETNPLHWMSLGAVAPDPGAGGIEEAEAKALQETSPMLPPNQLTQTFTVGAGASHIVVVDRANNPERPSWDGTLVVEGEGTGDNEVLLSYRSEPQGEWNGIIYYFGNFRDTQIDTWIANPSSISAAEATQNAFLRDWARFRLGALTYDQFRAMLQATSTGSWTHPSVRDVCEREPEPGRPGGDQANGACYLYDKATEGFVVYSTDIEQMEVPSGVVELPFSINLRPQAPGSANYEGRINSNLALQYAGYSSLDVTFEASPTSPSCTNGACLADLAAFDATVSVGLRYKTTFDDTLCAPGGGVGTMLSAVPWYVPAFLRDTIFDSGEALNYHYECRDTLLPLEDAAAINANLAGANPIPDGRPRVRHLELIDGFLVDQEQLLVLVRESYEDFVGVDAPGGGNQDPISAYAVISLSRAPTQVDEEDYAGNAIEDNRIPAFEPGLSLACDPDLIEEALGLGHRFIGDIGDAEKLANALITGVAEEITVAPLSWNEASPTDEQVHYLCHDTGAFDFGPNGRANAIPCPVGSEVTYFTTRGLVQSQVDAQPCHQNARFQHAAISIGDQLVCPTSKSDCRSEARLPRQVLDAYTNQASVGIVEQQGSCQATLNQWVASNRFEIRLDLNWQCEDPGADGSGSPDLNAVHCDAVRIDPTRSYDLRSTRLFYPAVEGAPVFNSIDSEIADAFRYRVRFRSRSGQQIGFVPTVCEAGSNLTPYCYDPAAIEGLRDRVDCLLTIFDAYYDNLAPEAVNLISKFLEANFSYTSAPERCVQLGGSDERCSRLDPLLHYDGFERHYAELLVMLGDDAFTDALGSRFDLAGTNLANFKGSRLEPNGIDLTGGAGYEMLLLYRAAQYYEMVLDRFYHLSPNVWDVRLDNPKTAFVTGRTATSYVERLVLASTKLSRVWNQIARRYQSFNRPDLARRVIERGYTRAYLESMALTRYMHRIVNAVSSSSRPQIVKTIDDAQRRYRIAMLDMAEAYGEITNEVNFFGFAPDYIPFPGLRPQDPGAVQLLIQRAWQSVNQAKEREDAALSSTRSFDTDAAMFQSELARVGDTYEDQLVDICGSFEGTDGNIYPAITRYIDHFNGVKSHEGLPPVVMDPCGLVDNGQIFEARLRLEEALVANDGLLEAYQDAVDDIRGIEQQVNQRCAIINSLANYEYEQAGATRSLEDDIRRRQNELNAHRRSQENLLSGIETVARVATACSPTLSVHIAGMSSGISSAWNPIACASESTTSIAKQVINVNIASRSNETESAIRGIEDGIAAMQQTMAFRRNVSECSFAKLEAQGQLRGSFAQLGQLQIQLLQQRYQSEIIQAQLAALRNKAKRLVDQQDDALQLLLNVEAVKNDPNVRIYQNAAVIRADRSFYAALRAVYRATRVFEYYASQTYARTDELFLVRMVSQGELNVEDYLIALENAFFDFEEQYGVPDTRVELLSLRDDILQIERYEMDGTPSSQAARIARFRERLSDTAFLDRRGYTALPFSTAVDQLSPLTRNHKILYVEAEIIGSDIGDPVGRVYLRPRGTSTVRGLDGLKQFFAFPEITAVVNPFFNGQRVFNPEIYRNDRLRDRPFANTQWELVLNQRDESVNQDVNLNSLTDIRLYIFYTDFTEL